MTFRVGLDTSALSPDFKEHALRGIGRYVFELKRYFDAHSDPSVSVTPFRHEEFAPKGLLDGAIDLLPYGRQTVRQQIVFPLRISAKTAGRFELLHFPAHMDAPSWSVKGYMLTVLDLIPVVCADLYKADNPSWRYHLARWLEFRAMKNAEHIVTISENSAKDIERILHIPRERITVTPLGVDESFFAIRDEGGGNVRGRLGIPLHRPIVLYVGGIDPRKNYPALVRVERELVDAARQSGEVLPLLVMAGKIDRDRQYPKLQALIREAGLEEDVILPGYVSDSDLQLLYRESSVFFFPSFYEGFGLPPLEAMAAGLPVVSSNTSAMPEVVGSAAALVDPADTDAAVREIRSILGDRGRAERMREEGVRQARLFTWERTGRATLEAYRLVERRRAVSGC